MQCGIHHNKNLIDTIQISLTGFCLCKHPNTKFVSFWAFHEEIRSQRVYCFHQIGALLSWIAARFWTWCFAPSIQREHLIFCHPKNDRSTFLLTCWVNSLLTAVSKMSTIILIEIYSRKLIINLLTNNCFSFAIIVFITLQAISSALFIAFVPVWNCRSRKLPNVKMGNRKQDKTTGGNYKERG